MKNRIEETVRASLDDGFKFSSARWHTLAWNKDGVQPELVITHSHTDNSIYIYKPLAETLHWINTKSNQADSMGQIWYIATPITLKEPVPWRRENPPKYLAIGFI